MNEPPFVLSGAITEPLNVFRELGARSRFFILAKDLSTLYTLSDTYMMQSCIVANFFD